MIPKHYLVHLFFLIIIFGLVVSFDVNFEGREKNGYFLKPAFIGPHGDDDYHVAGGTTGSIDRFTLLSKSSPGSSATVKAEYGPFVSRQTIPLSGLYAIVDQYENFTGSNDDAEVTGGRTENLSLTHSMMQKTIDVSAHLVVNELRRDNPVLKVLFHTTSVLSPGNRPVQHQSDFSHGGHFCVTLLVHLADSIDYLNATCSPSHDTGTCLAEIVIPSTWWPPMDERKTPKSLKKMAQLEYTVVPRQSAMCENRQPTVSVPANIHISDIPLSTFHGGYEEVQNDDFVRIMVPKRPVYPRSKIYVPVYLQSNPAYPIYVFVIRARVRNGLKIAGAEVSQPNKWTIQVDLNSKQTIATVTVFANEATPSPSSISLVDSNEVFSWLLEVDADATYHDTGVITWNLRYVLDASMAEQYDFDDENNLKMTSRLDIQKDDIQAVLPIAKSSELVNTAVLNGRQVSRAMKVFIVSQSGQVSDVTLQSSCRSDDESILKISSSCTSVYLDGSEIRGSQNVTVFVKYGTYTGHTGFIVWMPELPLEIHVSDTKLSQIKGWKISDEWNKRRARSSYSNKPTNLKKNHPNRSTSYWRYMTNKRRNNDPIMSNRMSSMRGMTKSASKAVNDKACRLRYQQTKVEVYAKFLAVDDSSGRESYLISRKTSLRITDLVQNFLRVSDSRIASLDGRRLLGRQIGRTEIQVLSPISGRVIGAKEVRIGGEKVSVTRLEVAVVTGLQLSVRPNTDPMYGYVAHTYVTHKLTGKYQEGVLDIRVHFSDGTTTPLRDMRDSFYHLSVASADSSIIAFAPIKSLNHPRVIAIGEGKGNLIQVSLELPRSCRKRRSHSLAFANAYVNVEFNSDETNAGDATVNVADDVQNDSYFNIKLKAAKERGDLEKPVNDVFFHAKKTDEPSVQARHNPNSSHGNSVTPLWIGIYALLGVFGLAIVVFTVSCMVFAVRYRRKNIPKVHTKITEHEYQNIRPGENAPVAHAHDWVWLGRATLERNSMSIGCSQNIVPMSDMNGNEPSIQSSAAMIRAGERRPSVCSHRCRNACRNSNISYPGSEVNIQITSNPQSDETAAPLLAPPPKLTRVPSQKAVKVPSWVAAADAQASRDKRVRITSNPMSPNGGIAPVPPPARHNFRNSGMSTFTIKDDNPPPVPPHANIVPQTSHANKPSTGRAVASDKDVLPIPCCVEDMEQDAEWESVAMGMDYDQLMEYFDNLKESNA